MVILIRNFHKGLKSSNYRLKNREKTIYKKFKFCNLPTCRKMKKTKF